MDQRQRRFIKDAYNKYAAQYARLVRILGAYRQQVRTEVRTSGSHPLTRTWCEPGRQPVIKSYGCQALVSTVVYRVLQWFPLETWSPSSPPMNDHIKTTIRTLYRSRLHVRFVRSKRVESDTLCRNQHGFERTKVMGYGAGFHFDHALTECETGMRRNPRRAAV